jgi:hypothetical protein
MVQEIKERFFFPFFFRTRNIQASKPYRIQLLWVVLVETSSFSEGVK